MSLSLSTTVCLPLFAISFSTFYTVMSLYLSTIVFSSSFCHFFSTYYNVPFPLYHRFSSSFCHFCIGLPQLFVAFLLFSFLTKNICLVFYITFYTYSSFFVKIQMCLLSSWNLCFSFFPINCYLSFETKILICFVFFRRWSCSSCPSWSGTCPRWPLMTSWSTSLGNCLYLSTFIVYLIRLFDD